MSSPAREGIQKVICLIAEPSLSNSIMASGTARTLPSAARTVLGVGPGVKVLVI